MTSLRPYRPWWSPRATTWSGSSSARIGRALHEDPQVPNFGRRGTGPVLQEGMTLGHRTHGENQGTRKVNIRRDGWTAVTGDGSLSAHFEHSVAVMSTGPPQYLRPVRPAGERAPIRAATARNEAAPSAVRACRPHASRDPSDLVLHPAPTGPPSPLGRS